MNILLVSDAYPPEIRAISYMVRELAEDFSRRGNSVTVLTCWPQYNLGEGVDTRKFQEVSIENKNIKVIRVKTPPHHKVPYFVRGISQMLLPYLFESKIRKYVKERIDTVVVYSPPLPLAVLGAKIKKIYKARYLLNVQDIFPQNAIDLGVLRNKWQISFFENMEKKAYRCADWITSHTDQGRQFLIEHKEVPLNKISTVHNWINFDEFRSANNAKGFRAQYGLEDKFIFLFAGVIGPAQGLDFIIDIAQQVKSIPEICFLFVGDGVEKKRLQKRVHDLQLSNVVFKPFVASEDYPYLLKEVDAGLVCLSAKNQTSVIPGKVMGFMAAGLAMAAFLNKENDGHLLIQQAHCGCSSLSGDLPAAEKIIRKIFVQRDQLIPLGLNGYQYAAINFSREVCLNKIENIIAGK